MRREEIDHLVHHSRIEHRLVTLDVHDDIRAGAAGRLRDAVGPAGVRGAGQHRFSAEGLHRAGDAAIVGGDNDPRNAAGGEGPLVDVLHHRLAVNIGQHLPLIARGAVAGGNDAERNHGYLVFNSRGFTVTCLMRMRFQV